MTDRYCIVGRNVSHSPSPAMMNAAFRRRGIDANYTRLSVPEARFVREFGRLMEEGTKGMNVTIPFKSAVIPWLGGLDAVATRIQAVNTVKKEAGQYVGYNTDPDGIEGPLRGLPAMKEVRNAMLIGAGGAARAFCEAMNRIGCVDVAVAVRHLDKARRFVEEMEKAFPRMNLTLAPLDDLRHLNHDLVFNATPMGTDRGPIPKELKRIMPGTRVVFDAVYRPRNTKLLLEGKRTGAKLVYGDQMLLHQGMAAFRLWTGKDAPEKEMADALKHALGQAKPRAKKRRARH